MSGNLLPAVVMRLIFGMVGVLILATSIQPSPVQAHVGKSEEIEEVNGRIQDNPGVPELYLLRRSVHRISGHWAEAIADFLVMQRIVLGLGTVTLIELEHGNLYPVGAPDGQIDV